MNIQRNFGIVCTMKKFLIVLIIIFICGVLSAEVCLKQIEESAVLAGREFYEKYATSEILFKDVFWNILYERIKLFSILILLCFTPLKEYLHFILAPVFSFIWGFFLMSSIMELGVAGFVVGLGSVLPHGILYGAVIGVLIGKKSARKYHVRNKIAINMGLYIFMLQMFITACVMETLMGTHFIPWVIRLSFI